MARDQQPVTDDEIEELREKMDEQRSEIREALAEDLGGEPEDYKADRAVADGGNTTDSQDE
ncbi:MAG: hypothetical protein ABEI98_00330 [Halorhabdus sp.]